jgi:hypothetical protein
VGKTIEGEYIKVIICQKNKKSQEECFYEKHNQTVRNHCYDYGNRVFNGRVLVAREDSCG